MEKYFNWSDVEKFRKNVLDSKIRTEFEKCAAKGKDVYDEKLADTFERIKSEGKDKKDKVESYFKNNEKARLCAIIVAALCAGIIIGCLVSRRIMKIENKA